MNTLKNYLLTSINLAQAEDFIRKPIAAVGLLLILLASAVTQAAAQGTWSSTGSMDAPHHNGHTATRLRTGKVLVAGGLGDNNATVATAEIYDPATGTWSATASMSVPRSSHAATLLRNGKVLVTGGFDQRICFPDCVAPVYESAEIYDPQTGIWSSAGNMSTARYAQTATRLRNGDVLVAGGLDQADAALSSAEIYDIKTGTWQSTANMLTARGFFTEVRLHNGKVLVAGGLGSGGVAVAAAELYNPKTGTWKATGAMSTERFNHTAASLHGGRVLVAGGYNEFFANSYASAEISTRKPALGRRPEV
ncbi:MAG: kelch repeat-containing protein [Pyrinomonadaceae bacterium]